jgi:hypothetical protein
MRKAVQPVRGLGQPFNILPPEEQLRVVLQPPPVIHGVPKQPLKTRSGQPLSNCYPRSVTTTPAIISIVCSRLGPTAQNISSIENVPFLSKQRVVHLLLKGMYARRRSSLPIRLFNRFRTDNSGLAPA